MEDIFDIKYNTKMDRLELPKDRKTKKILKVSQRHKFMSVIFTSFMAFSIINFYLIYSFMKILENV